MAENFSLHMKRKKNNSKNEKYFNFLKMDKKNVQNDFVKNTLTDEKFCLHIENLSSQFKRNMKKFMMIFFYIFCGKVFRNFSCFNI